MAEDIKQNPEVIANRAKLHETVNAEELLERLLNELKEIAGDAISSTNSTLEKVISVENPDPEDEETAKRMINEDDERIRNALKSALKKLMALRDSREGSAPNLDNLGLTNEEIKASLDPENRERQINILRDMRAELNDSTTGQAETNSLHTEEPASPNEQQGEPPVAPPQEPPVVNPPENTSEQGTPTPSPSTDNSETQPSGEQDDNPEIEEGVEPILAWIDNLPGNDKDFSIFLSKALLEGLANPNDPAKNEFALLIKKLPEMFDQIYREIDSFTKGKENYKLIENKKLTILKAFLGPVNKGHITPGDLRALVESISVVSRLNPPKELAKSVEACGYDGVMFFREGNMYIFAEALVDVYTSQEGKVFPDGLDVNHMITHEISHAFTETVLKDNEKLTEKCKFILENAERLEAVKLSQSHHIQNVLDSLKPDAMSKDYEKWFAEKGYDVNEKEAHRQEHLDFRLQEAAVEIMTDYTAIYLQSDGTLDDFILTCLIKTPGQPTDKIFEIPKTELLSISQETDEVKKVQLIENLKKNPEYAANYQQIYDIYKTFHQEIESAISAHKGGFAKIVAEARQGEEEPDWDFGGGGYYDSAGGFPNSGNNANPKNEGMIAATAEALKAFAEGVNVLGI